MRRAATSLAKLSRTAATSRPATYSGIIRSKIVRSSGSKIGTLAVFSPSSSGTVSGSSHVTCGTWLIMDTYRVLTIPSRPNSPAAKAAHCSFAMAYASAAVRLSEERNGSP